MLSTAAPDLRPGSSLFGPVERKSVTLVPESRASRHTQGCCYAARQRRRESVAVVRHTSALPLEVTPTAPAVEQNAPGCTTRPSPDGAGSDARAVVLLGAGAVVMRALGCVVGFTVGIGGGAGTRTFPRTGSAGQ